jgi:predicted transposase/invertase (TIGR01784 family)
MISLVPSVKGKCQGDRLSVPLFEKQANKNTGTINKYREGFSCLFLLARKNPVFGLLTETNMLEVLDINYDRLPGIILERKDALDGYSFLVEKVRKYKQEDKRQLDETIELAIEDTKKEGYLVEYLSRKEFMTMVLKTWTVEEQMEFFKKEAREEGREEGIEKGREEKAISMAKEMLADGEPIEKIVKYSGLSESQILKL